MTTEKVDKKTKTGGSGTFWIWLALIAIGVWILFESIQFDNTVVESSKQFVGTGSFHADKPQDLTLKEGAYIIETSTAPNTGRIIAVSLLRKANGARWTWRDETIGGRINVGWSSTNNLFPGDYLLRVVADRDASWTVTVTKVQ